MIKKALAKKIKVILLTPSPDINHVPCKAEEPLNQHAEQIRQLAKKHNVGLADSLSAFDTILKEGVKNKQLLSNGYNHPDKRGHQIVTDEIIKWFK